MREILFKAKRIDTGDWVEGYYVKDPLSNHRIYWQPFLQATSNTFHFVDPSTVCQYTGKNDKNGVKIFEGDTLHMGDTNIKYTVIFQDCGFVAKQYRNRSTAGIEYWQKLIVVTGNIYDNKVTQTLIATPQPGFTLVERIHGEGDE